MELSLSDELFLSTVKIRNILASNEVSSGTGFFWTVAIENNQELSIIITNRHVVEKCDWLEVLCHHANSDNSGTNGQTSNYRISRDCIVDHPDPNIDLCAILFGHVLNQAKDAGSPIFFKCGGSSIIPTPQQWDDFDSIEDVTMIGCPRGIYDTHNSLPIVRRGSTATPLRLNYEGKPEFLVDMACFPGSSGSPVYMFSRGHFNRKTKTYSLGSLRFYLLGVLYSGPQLTNEGSIQFAQVPKVIVPSMMHLGQVIKSTEIDQLELSVCSHVNAKRR